MRRFKAGGSFEANCKQHRRCENALLCLKKENWIALGFQKVSLSFRDLCIFKFLTLGTHCSIDLFGSVVLDFV